jgi:type I restriction enzyme S subunit
MSGAKQYEFRKQIFKDESIKTVFIYSSSPQKKIVACFRVGRIIEGHPDYLWEEFWDVSGLSEPEFFEYFSGKENGFAIRIDELEKFDEPVDPYAMFERFVPPQSFCYVDHSFSTMNCQKISSEEIE